MNQDELNYTDPCEVDIYSEPYRQPTARELIESREYLREFVA